MFSSDDRAVFIGFDEGYNMCLKVWHPYLDDDNENRLTILARRPNTNRGFQPITFSNDSTMVVVHNKSLNIGILWSIDMDHNSLTQELQFQAAEYEENSLCFTSDDKYIVCNTTTGPTFLSINEKKLSIISTHVFNYGMSRKIDLEVFSFSPNTRKVFIKDWSKRCNFYITSYFV